MTRNEPVPDILQQLYQPPAVLYGRGAPLADLLDRPRLAVVGSRKITPYGAQVTAQLVRQAAASGVVIISGLAYGVDALAHQATIDAGGTTVAILAGGLDAVYPRRHESLATGIISKGGTLLSEYPDGTAPLKYRFIARNRLIAGLADAVLVTEAAAQSGSLHTAAFANELGRDVFAVPGMVTQPMSAGTNALIRDYALPVLNANDILSRLNVRRAPTKAQVVVDDDNQASILECLRSGPLTKRVIQEHTGMNVANFNTALTMLELEGHIIQSQQTVSLA